MSLETKYKKMFPCMWYASDVICVSTHETPSTKGILIDPVSINGEPRTDISADDDEYASVLSIKDGYKLRDHVDGLLKILDPIGYHETKRKNHEQRSSEKRRDITSRSGEHGCMGGQGDICKKHPNTESTPYAIAFRSSGREDHCKSRRSTLFIR